MGSRKKGKKGKVHNKAQQKQQRMKLVLERGGLKHPRKTQRDILEKKKTVIQNKTGGNTLTKDREEHWGG